VLVDAQGQRFVNEDAYYGRLGEAALCTRRPRWLVVDDAVFEQPTYEGNPVAAVGDTPEELERELGLPEGSLAATLALYNRHARRAPTRCSTRRALRDAARDAALRRVRLHHRELDLRRVHARRPHTDPTGACSTATATRFRPVRGGAHTSGLSVGGYSSGLSLGDGTFFGAARGAARGRLAT
jgi:3-oxo-5alpha-steroid 4-dehydrogenase